MQAQAKIWLVSATLITLSGCAGEAVDDARKPSQRTLGSGGNTSGYMQNGYGSAGSSPLGKGGTSPSLAGSGGYGLSGAGTSSAGSSSAPSTGGGGASAGGTTGSAGSSTAGSTSKAGAANSGTTAACPSPAFVKLPNGACTERIREYDIGATKPMSIVLGSDQRLWVDDDTANQIIQLDAEGRPSGRIKADEGSSPRTLAGGKDDAIIWYTDWKAQSLVKVLKGWQKEPTPLAFKASALALGANNDLFLTEFDKAIYRVRPNQPVATRWDSRPGEIMVVSPDNNVWVSQGSALGQLIPTAGVTDFPLEEGFADGLCVGPDSALWFSDAQGSRLKRVGFDGRFSSTINLPTGTTPTRIITGPDGALWFIESGTNMIGRYAPKGGAMAHYTIPTAGSMPHALAVGPDKNIWFTEVATGKVGRLIPDPVQ